MNQQTGHKRRLRIALQAFAAAGALALSSCLSYTYSGIVEAEKLPDEGIIGMSRDQLINTYGMPEQVIPFGQAQTDSEPVGPPTSTALRDDHVIYMYHHAAQHRVILYQRTRAHTYAVYLIGGRVSEVKTQLTTKGDGLTFSVTDLPMGGPGKGQ